MVSSTLCPAVHILGSQNVYGRAEGIADHYWPWAVFFSIFPSFPSFSFFFFFYSLLFSLQVYDRDGLYDKMGLQLKALKARPLGQ